MINIIREVLREVERQEESHGKKMEESIKVHKHKPEFRDELVRIVAYSLIYIKNLDND
jgi:hypothetical protein